MESGKTMDISHVSELGSENGTLAGSIKKVGNSYKIEESALKSLINSNIEQYNIAIANQTEETKTAIKETEKRIKAYEDEMEAYTSKEPRSTKYELYGHASPTGYSGGTFQQMNKKHRDYGKLKLNKMPKAPFMF